jgi:hypothetical protein
MPIPATMQVAPKTANHRRLKSRIDRLVASFSEKTAQYLSGTLAITALIVRRPMPPVRTGMPSFMSRLVF